MQISSDKDREAWLDHARKQIIKYREARDKANAQIDYWLKVQAKAQAGEPI